MRECKHAQVHNGFIIPLSSSYPRLMVYKWFYSSPRRAGPWPGAQRFQQTPLLASPRSPAPLIITAEIDEMDFNRCFISVRDETTSVIWWSHKPASMTHFFYK